MVGASGGTSEYYDHSRGTSTLSTIIYPDVLIHQGQGESFLPIIPSANTSENDSTYHSLINSDTRSRDHAHNSRPTLEGDDQPMTLLHSEDMCIHSTDGTHLEIESVPYSDIGI